MFKGNTSFLSQDRGEDGSSYSTSFELYPYSEDQTFALYHGVFNGQYIGPGTQHGKHCTVRSLVNITARYSDFKSFVERNKHAQFLAKEFNDIVLKGLNAIVFAKTLTVEMDKVWNIESFAGRLLLMWKPHRKRLTHGEVVVLEDYIKSSFIFIDEHGFVGSSECDVLQAFGHFSWFFTNGQMLISKMTGQKTQGRYLLTDPVIHSNSAKWPSNENLRLSNDNISVNDKTESVEGRFGECDKGLSGMMSFFRHHRCNSICRDFTTPVYTHEMQPLSSN